MASFFCLSPPAPEAPPPRPLLFAEDPPRDPEGFEPRVEDEPRGWP